MKRCLPWAGFILLSTSAMSAQAPTPPQFPLGQPKPKSYVAKSVGAPPVLDGKLDDSAWKQSPWSSEFVDIEGDKKPKPRFRTRMKMCWDSQNLYIGAQLDEPHVWGTLTQHDAVIFQDNDFEVFIDPDGDNHMYAEFEMNALNTGWDLLLRKPYKDGGPAENSLELTGIRTSVHVNGSLNDPSDSDRYWSLEIAIPWTAFRQLTGVPLPPRDGDQWKINFSRVEWLHDVKDGKYVKVPGKPEDNWVWSPQGIIDMHRPERWGTVQFSSSSTSKRFKDVGQQSAKDMLHAVYYAQHSYRKTHGRFAKNLSELGLPEAHLSQALHMTTTGEGFEVRMVVVGSILTIRQDSKFITQNP